MNKELNEIAAVFLKQIDTFSESEQVEIFTTIKDELMTMRKKRYEAIQFQHKELECVMSEIIRGNGVINGDNTLMATISGKDINFNMDKTQVNY